MKKIQLAALLLAVSTASFAQTILVGLEGESNWVSRAKADVRFEVTTTPGAYWYKQSTNTLEPVTDPIGEGISQADNRSAAPALVKKLKELLPTYNVIIVPSAVGGTTIDSWTKGELYYERAKTMWNAAVAYCATNNIPIAKKFIAWEQGGNDVGMTETDGYYYLLNKLVSDFVTDFGVEKVFGVRIGYDPNYAPALEAEKIMKGHKLLNFNHPNYILASNAAATFTFGNEKMQGDLVHFTLKGINELGVDVATAIHLYETSGQKPSLTEPVAALQSVTTGYINLTPDWDFEFNGNTLEGSDNATLKMIKRDGLPDIPVTYDNNAVVVPLHYALKFSRPFSFSQFTLESRVKFNGNNKTYTLVSNFTGSQYNKLNLFLNNGNSNIEFGTADQFFVFDLPGVDFHNFHTIKITQNVGSLSLYIDDVLKGTHSSSSAFTSQYIGLGSYQAVDMDGTVDYFKLRNTVDNIALPVKFKSFKATNIK